MEQIEFPAKLDDVLQSLDSYLNSSDHFRAFWYPHTENVMCYSISRTSQVCLLPVVFIKWILEFKIIISANQKTKIKLVQGQICRLLFTRISLLDWHICTENNTNYKPILLQLFLEQEAICWRKLQCLQFRLSFQTICVWSCNTFVSCHLCSKFNVFSFTHWFSIWKKRNGLLSSQIEIVVGK